MDDLPIQYLHLETIVLPIFLALVLLIQLARSSDPGYFIARTRIHMIGVLACGGVLLLAFGALLAKVSPLLAVELAAGCVLSLLHPVNALCFFVHLIYLRPWEIVVGHPLLMALPRGAAALSFMSWALHPDRHAKPTGATLRLLNIVLAFSAWLFLSTFFVPHVAETQTQWFDVYFKSLVAFIMCIFFIDSERSVSEFKLTIIVSTLAFIVIRLYQVYTEGSHLIRIQSGGMFGDSNDLAAIVIMALPFALVPTFKKTAHLGQQISGTVFGLLCLAVIWYSQSRGAMLALVAQILTVGYMRSKGSKWLTTLVLAGLLGLGYTVMLKTIGRQSAEMEVSADSRITYWKTAINMTVRHPIFGVGFNQYPENYDAYTVGTKHDWGHRTAHSSWFLAFAESGFLGGALFLSFFLIVLKTAWRNRVQRPDELYSLVGYGVAMSFLSHTYIMDIYLLAGLIMASSAFSPQTAYEL